MKSIFLNGVSAFVLTFSFSIFADYPVKPDPSETPGEKCSRQDRHFDGYRYNEHIPYCRRNVSRSVKSHIYDIYSIPNHCRGQFTVDHFYPLSMGGNNSTKNLWPEHVDIKALRQDLEQVIFEQLRDGEITQKEALEIIEDAKMNPPVDELNRIFARGSDCDRAAMDIYLNR